MNKGFVIAIDGPVASGKGTLAALLSEKLNGFYLYTGAMYRSVALLCLEKGLNIKDEESVKRVLTQANFEFKGIKVFLNGKDVTERIKEPDIASAGSIIATYSSVREDLVRKQQEIGLRIVEDGIIVVAEGRDTATKVFPKAEVKIFLTATPGVKAKRRLNQYKEKGIEKSYNEVLSEINLRDKSDSERKISPLVPAKDSIKIDTTNDRIEDTFKKVMEVLKKKGLYE